MTWDYYEEGKEFTIKKEEKVKKNILDTLDKKQTKRLKKILQSMTQRLKSWLCCFQIGTLKNLICKTIKLVTKEQKHLLQHCRVRR